MASKDKTPASASGTPAPAKKAGRFGQILQTYQLTRRSDPRIGLILAGVFLLSLGVVLAVGVLLGARGWGLLIWVLFGLAIGLLVATIIFGRRAEKAAYAQIEGQTGAAAAVLQTLRKGWFVTPMVGVTKNQDVVHRVIGTCGVVLVSEGPSARVGNLLAVKKKETARWVPDIPIHEIECGDELGQVPLGKLNRAVMKLPRTLRAAEVTEVRRRLDAMAQSQNPLPIPKGPLPKNAKVPRNPR